MVFYGIAHIKQEVAKRYCNAGNINSSPSDVVAHAKVLEVAVVLEHVDRQVQRARFPRRCWAKIMGAQSTEEERRGNLTTAQNLSTDKHKVYSYSSKYKVQQCRQDAQAHIHTNAYRR